MQFEKTKIEKIFTEWLFKHYPKLSERKPMVYSDYWEIKRKWTNLGLLDDIDNQQPLRRGPEYMVVSKSIADYLKVNCRLSKSINLGE